ncbi:hypothetical protein VTJ49DRAFT_3752 [Mycothermus thermophilus]|uniref:Uncharacterized protein n=1 Tax=Humicola insolens TaxID=85995 RepID=A0ABR3V6T4_HUMIN
MLTATKPMASPAMHCEAGEAVRPALIFSARPEETGELRHPQRLAVGFEQRVGFDVGVLLEAGIHPRKLLRGRLALEARLPFGKRHALDELARRLLVELALARFLDPVGEAVAAEAGQPHQVDVLGIAARAQMARQPAECGGDDPIIERIEMGHHILHGLIQAHLELEACLHKARMYMTKTITPQSRKVRVLATLGPASDTPEMIANAVLPRASDHDPRRPGGPAKFTCTDFKADLS